MSADTRATLEKLAAMLEQNGARVERIESQIDYDSLWRTWGEIVGAEVGAPMPLLLRNAMRLHFLFMWDRFPIRKGMLRGVRLAMRELSWALSYRDEIVRRINCLLERFDVWLCPVSPPPAFMHRKPGTPVEVDGRKLSYFIATGGYTTPFNLSGHPVVVLPAGWSKEGLPIGVQAAERGYSLAAVHAGGMILHG